MPHSGLPSALNAGWRQVAGEHIVRIDADDVALPDRPARQVEFLDAHPEVGAFGTWTRVVGARKETVWRHPCDDAGIRCKLLFESALVHSSVMLRRTGLNQAGGYDPGNALAHDYDLWVRLAAISKLANLPEVLTVYRLHPGSVTRDPGPVQVDADQVRLAQLTRMGLQPTEADRAMHRALSIQDFPPTREFLAAAESWLKRL